jgi:hypothetical protein
LNQKINLIFLLQEVKDMVAADAPAEDESLPGMVPDDPGDEAPEAASDMAPIDPDDSEEPAPMSEEVIPEPENALEMDKAEDADDVGLVALS